MDWERRIKLAFGANPPIRPPMLNVLSIASLFPDASRPVFGVFVERSLFGLAERDVRLEVIAPIGVAPWPLSLHPHYRARAQQPGHEIWKGLSVHRPHFPVFPGSKGIGSARLMARAILPLVEKLHREKPFDVVDAQFFYPDGAAAMRIAAKLGLPYSVKARGADIHLWGNAPGTRNAVRAAGRRADGLLAVSAAMKRDMAALGMPEDRIRVHYTGVDLDRFAPGDRAALKARLGVTGPLIASLGALIPRKGHDIVIGALGSIPGATLIIVGQGPEREALEQKARTLGLDDRVRFTGSLPHEQLPEILAAADAMALASSSEGLANAWVESLACGTPIVIADAGGARELLDRPWAGRIAARTPEAFAAAINELLAAPPLPEIVRKTAERYSWDANAQALFEHLSGIAHKG